MSPHLDADEAKEQAGGGQRERRRISNEHEENHAPEHQGRHIVPHYAHWRGFSYLNSASITCSRAAMRLMISEMPCRAIKAKPTGSSSLTGHRISPPALEEASLIVHEFDKPRPREIDEDDADRQQEQEPADDVDPDARALGH